MTPFYNEDERLLETAIKLTQLNNINSYIFINDGSTAKKTKQAVAELKKFAKSNSKIRIIEHKTNQGKSAAIKTGLDLTKTDWVFLIDADLKNLKIHELQKAIDLTNEHQHHLDMLILRRSAYSRFVTAIRHDILMSGERILRTADLRKVYQGKPFKDYQLEVAVNHYMLQNRKNCYWLQTSLANSYKIHKWGLLKSLSKYKDELTGYTSYAGVRAYLRQVGEFCREKID